MEKSNVRAMTKIKLLEEIHELKRQDVSRKDFYEDLYYKVRDNKISIADAGKQLIISETFYRKIQGKPLAENMLKFSKGMLKDEDKILKMISSMITQLFIMKEQDPDFDIGINHYDDILNLLSNYGNTGKIDYLLLSQIITDLGCAVDNETIKNIFNIKSTKSSNIKLNDKSISNSSTKAIHRTKLPNHEPRLKEILSTKLPNDTNVKDELVNSKIDLSKPNQVATIDQDSVMQANAEKIQEALANVDVSNII